MNSGDPNVQGIYFRHAWIKTETQGPDSVMWSDNQNKDNLVTIRIIIKKTHSLPEQDSKSDLTSAH